MVRSKVNTLTRVTRGCGRANTGIKIARGRLRAVPFLFRGNRLPTKRKPPPDKYEGGRTQTRQTVRRRSLHGTSIYSVL